LPDISNLYWLDCSNNQLTALPTLSNHLFLLGCSHNNLKTLPILPNSIRELYCNNNQIIILPTLPIGGLFFNFTNNPLTCLPTLPNYLLDLYIDSDKIFSLPNSVPGLKVYDSNSMIVPTPPLCPTTLTHTAGILATGTYVATQTINIKASLSAGTTNYHASQAITLNPGFQTSEGRTFSVEIRGCK
jgi:Leucine-rich repeat (LRR) protein